jgi:hypothetical protein
MERTWKPKAAGILCITIGAVCALPSIVILMIITVVSGEPGGTDLPIAELVGYWIFGGIVVTVPIVGGIYALRRRAWGLALAGSICALILPISWAFLFVWGGLVVFAILGILGILAVTFVVRGKREFK